jgi:hypothetical protein
MKCLSVRQPWAWLLVNGWKNVENRTWYTTQRGRTLIHASKSMTRGDYDACLLYIAASGMTVPVPAFDSPELQRGGIVGSVEILDCVTSHWSEWFEGPYGFVCDLAQTMAFVPCAGRLGFFDVAEPTGRAS